MPRISDLSKKHNYIILLEVNSSSHKTTVIIPTTQIIESQWPVHT